MDSMTHHSVNITIFDSFSAIFNHLFYRVFEITVHGNVIDLVQPRFAVATCPKLCSSASFSYHELGKIARLKLMATFKM